MGFSTRDIIFAADTSEAMMEALVETFQQATYRGGQHDLINCRICHNEENYHTGAMVHKPECPVGKATAILVEYDRQGEF